MLAAGAGKAEMVRFSLDNGADAKLKDEPSDILFVRGLEAALNSRTLYRRNKSMIEQAFPTY